MRHPKSRIHVQLRAESGLASFPTRPTSTRPEQGHRHVRATQVYDVQILLAGRHQEMEGEAAPTGPGTGAAARV